MLTFITIAMGYVTATSIRFIEAAQIAKNIGATRVSFDCIDILVMILAILASSTFRFI